MDIKDYLHLYLFCDARILKIEKSNYYFVHELHIHKGDELIFMPHHLAAIQAHGEGLVFKLILRPLSDMTREEEDEVAKLCFGDDDFIITYRGMGYDNKVHQSVRCLKLETFCEHPEINTWLPAALIQLDHEDTFCPIIIGRFENNGKVLKDDVIEKPFDLTHYLLKQHFDLFGLIEAGLATEATIG